MLKKWLPNLLLLGALLAGLVLLAYPSFSDWWNSFHQSRAITTYARQVANMDQAKYDAIWKAAQQYNEEIAKNGISWKLSREEEAKYNRLLSVDDTGEMGYIGISKIDVLLPLYHGTSEAALQTSIGHLTGSSLPAGGATSHCVLSGHRGLPSAKLFSDLDKLETGDRFTLNILDQVLTYEVDQIHIVEPTDLSNLNLEEGKDLCTLVTCTPYGINTHRLLVRGHRVANEEDSEIRVTADALQIEPVFVAPFVAAPILLLLLIALLVSTGKKRRRS